MAKFKLDTDLGFLKNITKEATRGVAKYPVISDCPVCHHDLVVTRLQCTNCGTELGGQFTLSKFNYLDTEKLYFIEVFVKNRGNIKAIEKEMGFSYPTIKKMLDEVIEKLGYSAKDAVEVEVKEEYKGPSRKEILEKIDSGEITVEEATELLGKFK